MVQRLSARTRVLLAFASVYFFWGSTYTAIHVADEHLPPPVISGVRSVLTTLILLVITRVLGKSIRVSRRELPRLALVGLLFMSANNMLLTWGETMVPSGFASLVVSTMPIMIALLERLLPGGESLNARGWTGTLLGFGGIVVLVWPSLHGHAAGGGTGTSRPGLGVAVLLVAALSWAIGSVLSRRFRFQTDTMVATLWQVGAAGLFNVLFATISGSFARAEWTTHGLISIAYLSVFGSIFGLISFTYLLQNVPVTKVATYAFVNPVVAVLLGVFVLHERLTRAEITGMAVIVCAVALVVLSRVSSAGKPVAEDVAAGAGGTE